MVRLFAFCAALLLGSAATAADLALEAGGWRVDFAADGLVTAFTHKGQSLPLPAARPALAVRLGERELPVHLEGTATAGERRWRFVTDSKPRIDVVLGVSLRQEGGAVVLQRDLEITASAKLTDDLTVRLPLVPVGLTDATWLPLKDGRGAALGAAPRAVYRFAGGAPPEGPHLALPLVTLDAGAPWGRVTVLTDPYFSTIFSRDSVEWTYPRSIGLTDQVERRRVATVLHDGTPDAALEVFYKVALPEVAPGPAWLHEIALVDYDYMSDAGAGWARDVAGLAEALPEADRRQALLCVHGWYDWVGRYSVDRRTGRLDAEWSNFGSFDRVKTNRATMNLEGVELSVGFAQCAPTRLTPAAVRERLALARAKGFRAALYFADGMNSGDGLPDFDPTKVLRWGGWGGPDMAGKTYVMNPLHPDVAPMYHQLMEALLREFGDVLDALVWDETFHVNSGDLGTAAYPGYADRAMMRLTRDLSLQVQGYNRRHGREIAFLASDAIGPTVSADAPPYALVAHGTYQDSHCNPGAWSYAIFPNYRNVAWSCCWWPVRKWDWVEWGVRQYQAAVSISNGWGDDLGFAEITPEQRRRVLELFAWRKQHPTRLRWLNEIPVWKPEVR